MGASKQHRRKQQRLIKLKKMQKDLANAVPLPPSDSAYKIVGGIAPEAFDTPEIPSCASSYKILNSVTSEMSKLSEPNIAVSMPVDDRGGDIVTQHATSKSPLLRTKITPKPKRPNKSPTSKLSKSGIDGAQEVNDINNTARFQSIEGFSSAFTFGATLPEKEKTEAFHRRHAPTPTSTRRIKAIFKDGQPLEATSASVDSSSNNDTTNAPSIFERLQVSRVLTATHGCEIEEKQQQLVTFSPDANSEAMRMLALGEPMSMISATIKAWVRDQSLQFFNLEAQQDSSIAPADEISKAGSSEFISQHDFSTQKCNNLTESTVRTAEHVSMQHNEQHWALVLYHNPYFSQSSEDSASDFLDEDEGNTESSSSSTWSVSRVFMATLDGFTYLVDHGQMLYNNIQVIDEDASDFDSIASPWKTLPHGETEAKNSLVLEFDENDDTTSEECEYSILQLHLDELTEDQGDMCEDDNDGSIDQEESQQTAQIVQEADVESYTGDGHPAEDNAIKLDDALHTIQDVAADKDDRNLNKKSIDVADWARALTHAILGTESLFTYMNVLNVETNGNATKIALATAFLELVDFERQKLEETLLPRSCTASSILDSKVLPHTIMLGTTSLAAFLSELEFDTNDETTLVCVFEAFKKLSEKELQVRSMAAQGIMGTLLRALGRST